MNVKIVNIHESKRYPGAIYAELREEADNSLCVSATLEYIFETLNDSRRGYNCINAQKDGFGNWSVIC